MLNYYLKLACISFRKTLTLSLLMVMTIAVGISAVMISYTIYYKMTLHPLPDKAETIQLVRLGSYSQDREYEELKGKEYPPHLVTYQDGMAIIDANRAKHQTLLSTVKAMTHSESMPKTRAKMERIRTAYNDAFAMFDIPFLYGSAWSDQADEDGELIAVLTKKMNDRLFEGENSVGRHIFMDGLQFRISGVMDEWSPVPKFYEVSVFAYEEPRGIWIPFTTQMKYELFRVSDLALDCWQDPDDWGLSAIKSSECLWIFLWVELESGEEKGEFLSFLNDYALEQKQLGRFEKPIFNMTQTISEYMDAESFVPDDHKYALWLAGAFLVLCLLNCLSLMMVKFHRKRGEVGLRRAVGASKQSIAAQFIIEAVLIGLLGGIAGTLLTLLGLTLTQQSYQHLHIELMQLDGYLILCLFCLSIVCTVLFGLIPINRAVKTQPSNELKSL